MKKIIILIIFIINLHLIADSNDEMQLLKEVLYSNCKDKQCQIVDKYFVNLYNHKLQEQILLIEASKINRGGKYLQQLNYKKYYESKIQNINFEIKQLENIINEK
jgi:hypothetical protein